jgi:hypothetical protein
MRAGQTDSRIGGGPDACVLLVDKPDARILLGETLHDRVRLLLRPVVDHEDLEAVQRLPEDGHERLAASKETSALAARTDTPL